MDKYQRESVNVRMPYCLSCERGDSELPHGVLQAARTGNVADIKEYIDEDHDVNALEEEETLLSSACANGHIKVVQLLLQCPEIHLNISFKGSTPLMRAAQNGHMECARLLLDSSVACDISIDKCSRAVVNVLKMQTEIKQESALHILKCARYKGHWDVMHLILQTTHYFSKEDLYPVVMTAVDQNNWDIIGDVFKRDFYGKNDLINEVFSIVVHLRCWERVEDLIRMMDVELKLELPFVKAALVGRVDEVQRLLTEKQYDAQTLNGSLLVVAAGGTTEPVAELLLTIKNTYTKRTFSDALFLAALGDSAEIFICLLSNSETSYSIQDLYQTKEILTCHSVNNPRKGYLVTFFNNFLDKFNEIKLVKLIH